MADAQPRGALSQWGGEQARGQQRERHDQHQRSEATTVGVAAQDLMARYHATDPERERGWVQADAAIICAVLSRPRFVA